MSRGPAEREARPKGRGALLLSCCPRHGISFCSLLLGGGEEGLPAGLELREEAPHHH